MKVTKLLRQFQHHGQVRGTKFVPNQFVGIEIFHWISLNFYLFVALEEKLGKYLGFILGFVHMDIGTKYHGNPLNSPWAPVRDRDRHP